MRTAFLVVAALLAAPLAVAPPASGQELDLNAIFNCEPGGPLGEQSPEQCTASRDLLLGNCTGCHTFVPIVKAHKPAELWDATLEVHRVRVPELSDEDFAQLTLFLKAHFNDQLDPPVLPPELEALGTGLPF